MQGVTGFTLQFFQGLGLTIQLAIAALSLGFLFALLLWAAQMSQWGIVRGLARLMVMLIRGLPELIVLLLIYYGSVSLMTLLAGQYVDLSPFLAGVIALSLIFAAYASQTLRGAYQAVAQGELEAATAFGFLPRQRFFRILLPQMLRYALPGLGNLWFVLLKDTALVSLLGAVDLMRAAQNATATSQKPFTFYCAAAVLYLVLTSLSLIGLRWVQRQYPPPGAERGVRA